MKSSIEKHLGSPKHKDNCKLGLEVKKHAAKIDTILTRQHQEVMFSLLYALTCVLQTPMAGFTLPADVHSFRAQVVAALMEAGTPLTALDGPNGEKSRLRGLLEMAGFALTGRRGLSDYIPGLRQAEIEAITCQLFPNPLDKKQCVYVGLLFDGSVLSESAEATALRWLDQSNPREWVVRQVLGSIQFLEKNPKGLELAGSVHSVVDGRFGIPTHSPSWRRLTLLQAHVGFRSGRPTSTQALSVTPLSHVSR